MIIDAMDLLYTDRFDAFCIVTSDSDFTRLASRSARIRQGSSTASASARRRKSLVSACDRSTYLDVLRGAAAKTPPAANCGEAGQGRQGCEEARRRQRRRRARAQAGVSRPTRTAAPAARRQSMTMPTIDGQQHAAVGRQLIAKRKLDFDSATLLGYKPASWCRPPACSRSTKRSSADGKQKSHLPA